MIEDFADVIGSVNLKDDPYFKDGVSFAKIFDR